MENKNYNEDIARKNIFKILSIIGVINAIFFFIVAYIYYENFEKSELFLIGFFVLNAPITMIYFYFYYKKRVDDNK